MTRSRALTIGATLITAALVVWWWTHRGRDADPVPPTGAETAADNTPLHRGAARDTSAGALPVLADDDPPGKLQLEGLVLGEDDQPVAGATVVLAANPPRTTTSGADGTFAFVGLVGRPYTLVARAPAGVAGPITARLTAHSEPFVLRLRKGASLTVDVVGPNAHPIDAAIVELRGIDDQRQTAAAGVATFASVVPGSYDVVAWAPGMAKAFASTRVAGATRLRIVLAAGAAAVGQVVDDHGEPVADARVIFAASGALVRGQADPRRDAVTSDAKGAFRFAALPAGSFRFVASHPDHGSGVSALVTLDGATERTGIVVTMPPGAVVSGRVLDTAHNPVPGARVRINDGGGGGGRRGGRGGGAGVPGGRIGQRDPPRQAYTDERGTFTIKGLPRAELFATASAEIGASSGVEVDTTKGDVDNAVIVLDLTATLSGTVVDDQGQPVDGAQVTAVPRGGGGSGAGGGDADRRGRGGPATGVTDPGGRFTLTGLSPGGYAARASRVGSAGGFGYGRRGRGGGGDGTDVEAGDQNVKLVLPAEGQVKGKVQMVDGTVPSVYAISIGPEQQSFLSDTFELDGVPPGDYTLSIRGPQFDQKDVDVTITSNQLADVGTIQLVAGRRIAGIVVSDGQPVVGATVYVGRQVIGSGTSNGSPVGGGPGALVGSATKTDTTDGSGAFGLSGFGDGDLAVVAELPSVGRSPAMRVTEDMPNQASLVLELQKYGSLSGVLTQGGVPAGGIGVTAQSTTVPGALYVVSSGPDGAFRFDALAPDTYKVSATVGQIRRGMKFYSQQVTLLPGQEVVVNLTADGGSVTVSAQPTASTPVGIVISWLASVPITATTSSALALQLAGMGPGASQMIIVRTGEPAMFVNVTPGPSTVCMVPLPAGLSGFAAISYNQQHGGKLPAFCVPFVVADAPPTQNLSIPVQIPPLLPN